MECWAAVAERLQRVLDIVDINNDGTVEIWECDLKDKMRLSRALSDLIVPDLIVSYLGVRPEG